MRYFSATTRSFFDSKVHGVDIPADCKEVPDEVYNNLLNKPVPGMHIVGDDHGFPILTPHTVGRSGEIKDRLARIDILSLRPMRAILSGVGTDLDKSVLSNLEIEAQSLRKEDKAL